MKKICVLFFILTTLLCVEAFSQTKAVIRETKGQGSSREQAIQKALAEAVTQVQGAIVSSKDYEFGYSSATADVDYKTDDAGKKVAFDAISVQTGGTVLKTEIGGLIKSYEVLEEKKINDNTYEVTLKAWVYDYQSPETKRVSIAVMPPKVLKNGYRFGSFILLPDQMSDKMTQSLSTGLTKTNKFSVLDRQHIAEFASNRNITISPDSSLEEKAKLGQVLGADYMLVGTVSDVRLEIIERVSSAIGTPIREYNADFVFDYQLIAGPTRQIKLADTVTIRLDETNEVKKLVKDWEPQNLDYRELTDNFITMAAGQVVKQIVDNLYPVRIAHVDENGQIIISQGGDRIAQGQILDVFTEGKEIIDPDTKESLGKTESLVATIKIDEVTTKISYATIVQGDLNKLSEGLICRDKKVETKVIDMPQSNIETTPSGGVKLPFDK